MGADVGFRPGGGEAWRSPWAMYAALRDHDPVHHVVDGDHWVLSRFDDVFRAARDPGTFSSAEGLTAIYGEREQAGLTTDTLPIVMMDPPEHTVVRRPIGRMLTPRNVAGLEPVIRAAAQECVGRLRDEGETDLVAVLGKPLPGVAVAHLLGVAPDDRADLDRWTDAIVSGGDALSGAGGVKAAVLELATAFAALIDERRTERGTDVFSALLDAVDAGAAVTDAAMLGVAFTMVAGGNDTMTGLLGGAAEWLTRRPAERRRLIDDPGLVPNAVEELLRLSSPLQAIGRTATRDVELHGRVIPEGRKVLLLYGSANRDPREFGPDAEDLDVGRRIDRLVAFGSGAHHCVGAAVARLQARVAIQELLATCPDFEVDLDAIEYAPGTVVRRPCAMPVTAG
ncbi:MAG: cytochrome P450 [Acidimicrobiales bacterium]